MKILITDLHFGNIHNNHKIIKIPIKSIIQQSIDSIIWTLEIIDFFPPLIIIEFSETPKISTLNLKRRFTFAAPINGKN